MSVDTMSAPELRDFITRKNRLKVRLIAIGESILAATIDPALRMARRRLAILSA